MLLGVNLDHIATLRNARGGFEPNIIEAIEVAEKAGADGITMHLREDRRHIKDNDLKNAKQIIKTRLNLEMACTKEMQEIAIKTKPQSCCLVPEKRQEVTTEGGLDVYSRKEFMKEFIKPLNENGIIVSLFIDPDIKQIETAKEINAPCIELHTGAFSNAFLKKNEAEEFEKLKIATKSALDLGIQVNAGHGLNYQNVFFMKEIAGLTELNIGHSII